MAARSNGKGDYQAALCPGRNSQWTEYCLLLPIPPPQLLSAAVCLKVPPSLRALRVHSLQQVRSWLVP